MQIAPFLISKSKRSGYRVVVAPSFLRTETANDLASWIGCDPDDNAIHQRTVKGTPDGDLIFFFRANKAPGKSDAQGRPVMRFEGICIPSREAENFVFNSSYLAVAERVNDPLFTEFWDWPANHTIADAQPIPYVAGLKADVTNLVVEERLVYHAQLDPKVGSRGASKPEKRIASATEGEPKKNGEPLAVQLDGLAGEKDSRDAKIEHSIFRSVCAVALGCTGVAVATNGVWGLKSDRPEDQRQRNWKQLFLRLGEIGLGVGLTWAAFVVGRAGIAAVRR